MKRKALVTIILLGTVVSIIYFKNINDDYGFVGTYIDGEYASNIPSKDDGYVVEKVVCDNEAVGEWNYDDWGLLVKNMSKKSKCNVYFKKGIKLADTITLVDTSGKCPTVNDDGSVNVTSVESENSLLCMAPDNYGTSYYFRGNVQNNYVYFANLYWRIIRINGDGSIRIIYDGTSAHANGESSEDRIIGTSKYNKNFDDNAYIGYMYGTPGSSTYEETHANINDSTIKKYIDTWYENNIKNNIYEKYLTDNLFCNNRIIYEGNGYGKEMTSYAGKTTLKCYRNEDSFTHDATGNKKLNYSIALISQKEVILSGGFSPINTKFYLFTGNYYWTMTPFYYHTDNARVLGITDDGRSVFDVGSVTATIGVKPVINLKPYSLKFGDGTISNAYRVS